MTGSAGSRRLTPLALLCALVVCALVCALGCAVMLSARAGDLTPNSTSGPARTASGGSADGMPSGVDLAEWKLTLPVAGSHGDAATVNPARMSPPWLTNDGTELTLWAPVNGVTTPNSQHARTELVSLTEYREGTEAHTLHATVRVLQLPTETPDVIVGQIHGAAKTSAVAFVMLHYRAGELDVVVKKALSGSESIKYPLLSGLPLGSPFDYTISDRGDASLVISARYGAWNSSVTVRIPQPFLGTTVRFQAGAYQQADSREPGSGSGDGARVSFTALSQVPAGS